MKHTLNKSGLSHRVTACVIFSIALVASSGAVDDPASSLSEVPPGQLSFLRGDHANAIDLWTEAYQRATENRALRDQMVALLNRAEAYQALGYYPLAIADLESALGLAADDSNADLTARVHGSLGNVYLLYGDRSRAAAQFDRCLQYANNAGDKPLQARTWNNVGNLLAGGRDQARGETYPPFTETARQAYERSHRLATEVDDRLLAADALLNSARVALSEGSYAEAQNLLQQALALYRRLPSSSAKAMGLISSAWILFRTDRNANSQLGPLIYAALSEGREVAEELADQRSLSYAIGFLASMYESEGQREESLRLSREALFLAWQASAPEIVYLWQWQIGRLLRSQGDRDGARAALEAAVSTLRTLRSDLVVGFSGGASLFQEDVGAVYLDLVDLLLEDSEHQPTPELVQATLVQVRDTMELLKTAELEDYFRDNCVAQLLAKQKPVDELVVEAAVLYPILLPDRVELLLTLPTGVKRATVRVGAQEITEQVLTFRRLLEKRTRQYIRPAQQLYDWLIRPIRADLDQANVETLVFIPSGVLRTIPIAPLHDGKKHLVESYASAVTPGLTLLDPRPISAVSVNPLLSGLSESTQGFEPLPHVKSELESIHQLLGGEVFIDAEFRTVKVVKALNDRPYSIVHVASHAEFKADARESYLVTYDGRLTMDNLESLIKLSQFREDPVELLTLSACATAAGDARAALGLAGVAVKAGARSALASLWFINDQASSDLIVAFYQRLRKPGASKAEALRQAQLALIADKRYRYPVYWAPFLLIGNWL